MSWINDVLSFLPEVKKPEQKKLSFKEGRSIPTNKGKNLSEIHIKHLSETRIRLGIKPVKSYKKGQVSYMKGKKFTEEHRRKISESQRGDKNKFWKGGIRYHHNYRIKNYIWNKLRCPLLEYFFLI